MLNIINRWAQFKANFLPPLKSPLVSLGTLDLKELVKVRGSSQLLKSTGRPIRMTETSR